MEWPQGHLEAIEEEGEEELEAAQQEEEEVAQEEEEERQVTLLTGLTDGMLIEHDMISWE